MARNGMDIHEYSRLFETPEGLAELARLREEYAAQFGRSASDVSWREKRATRRADRGGRRMWMVLKPVRKPVES